jgi:hypothetical protein
MFRKITGYNKKISVYNIYTGIKGVLCDSMLEVTEILSFMDIYETKTGIYSNQTGTYSNQIGTYSNQIGTYSNRIGTYSNQIGTYSNQIGTDSNQTGIYFTTIGSNKKSGGDNENLWDKHNRQGKFMPLLFGASFKKFIMNFKININQNITKNELPMGKDRISGKDHFRWRLVFQTSKTLGKIIIIVQTFKERKNYAYQRHCAT